MKLTRWTPTNTFKELFDEFFNDSWLPWSSNYADEEGRSIAKPAVDIYETEKCVVLKANMPGIKKDNIEITVEDGVLHIKGEVRKDEEVQKENYYKRERFYGSFQRSFALGENVNPDEIKAHYEDGVLTVEIPKKEQEKKKEVKKIEIK